MTEDCKLTAFDLLQFFKCWARCCVQNYLAIWPHKQMNEKGKWTQSDWESGRELCPSWKNMKQSRRGRGGLSKCHLYGPVPSYPLATALTRKVPLSGESGAKGDYSSLHIQRLKYLQISSSESF